MTVVVTEAMWLDESHEYSLPDLVKMSDLPEADLRQLVDHGVLAPTDPQAAQWTFRAECLIVARTACRLRSDFDLDSNGLALALTLLDRIHDLEAQVQALSARLPRQLRR